MSWKSLVSLVGLSLFSSVAEAKPQANNNPNNFRPRAEGPTLGLGVGMSVPSDSLDIFALRIRMNPNLIIEDQLQTLKLALESCIGKRIPMHQPVMTWLVQHAAMTLTR